MTASKTELTPAPVPSDASDDTSTIAVKLDGASVMYRVPREKVFSFKHHTIRWLKRQVVYESFWALRNVDLAIRRGEVFGVIGPNGAGKSTLLKLVAQVLRPTSGRVRVFGRVAPLLDPAAGFHYELTGRENIYLYSAVLGYRRADVEKRVDRIVDFAGLAHFIDAPIRTYSSGMLARLGFAVATDVQPDILIVDEVLAVGDSEFQRKSTARLEQFRRGGATILMVTHDLDAVARLCACAAWLEHGTVKLVGGAADVLRRYEAAYAG
jgi:ABC-2 type transport system ATP-binding protein